MGSPAEGLSSRARAPAPHVCGSPSAPLNVGRKTIEILLGGGFILPWHKGGGWIERSFCGEEEAEAKAKAKEEDAKAGQGSPRLKKNLAGRAEMQITKTIDPTRVS